MGERTIKVALSTVLRSLSLYAGVSFLVALIVWTLAPLPLPVRFVSAAVSFVLLLFLLQLRFLPHMTVAVWVRLWGSIAPVLVSSFVGLPLGPFVPMLCLLMALTVLLGAWAAYRFYPLAADHRLHRARFARLDEIEPLLCAAPCADGLVLGSVKPFFFFRRFVCVRPTKTKREIGNSLVIGPTGGGKGNHIETQILAYAESLIINDPKGDLFSKTAGARRLLGPVYVLDPTRGVGHSFDPLQGRTTEDDYFSVARALVFDPKEGIS
jgi:Type IV secretory system Conjugative DNA transfer